jgi:GTPase SAR1 family protein
MFNFHGGNIYAKILGKSNSNTYVSVDLDKILDDNDYKTTYEYIKLKDENKFSPAVNPSLERQILYIFGPSGSGKSTYTAQYIEDYTKKFKKRPVYLFSALMQDKKLDSFKELSRVILDETLNDNPIQIGDLANSLCVFDDIDVLRKEIKKPVLALLGAILETGRHFNISVVITNHLPSNGDDTRRMLNECHSVTFFPHSLSGSGTSMLKRYLGIKEKTQDRFKKMNTRWITIFKHYPQILMSEHLICPLSEFETVIDKPMIKQNKLQQK